MHFWIVDRQVLLFALACFILGLMLGITASLFYAGVMLDAQEIELETLYSELIERDSRIERLEKSLQDQRYRVVKNLSVELNLKDPHLNLKLSTAVHQLLQDLIGQEIDRLDPNLIRSIIDDRIIQIGDQSFSLRLRYLVIAETLYAQILVSASNSITE